MDSLYEVCTETKKVLIAKPQFEVTTYLFYSLPMSTFLWDEAKYPWILNHFNNIFLKIQEDNDLYLDYLEKDDFFAEVMEHQGMDLNETKKIADIITFLKEKISDGSYAKLMVDRFYIRDSNSHEGEHYPLQIFIHGYDDDQKVFLGIGFGEDYRFKQQVYTYDEIEKGFVSYNTNEIKRPAWARWYSCILYHPLERYKVDFDMKKFITELRSYVNSNSQYELLRPDVAVDLEKDVFFGLNIHNEIKNTLKLMLNDDVRMDFRHIHLITEQKKLMLKKMNYISSLFKHDKGVESRIEMYNNMVKDYEEVRLVYMKEVLKAGKMKGLFGDLKNKDQLTYMIGVFDKNIELEYEVLNQFLTMIS